MSMRNIVIIAVIVCLGALGGYFMGTRSPVVNGPYDQSTTGGGYADDGGESPQAYPASTQSIDHGEVLNELKARLKEKPDDFQTLARIGDTYFEMMRFKDALYYYKKAVEINSDDVDTYNDLGLTSHYMGNPAEALTYVDEGIKRNPYYQRIWLTRGFIMAYGLGNQEEAIKSWEKCRSIAPDTPVGKAALDYLAEFTRR